MGKSKKTPQTSREDKPNYDELIRRRSATMTKIREAIDDSKLSVVDHVGMLMAIAFDQMMMVHRRSEAQHAMSMTEDLFKKLKINLPVRSKK